MSALQADQMVYHNKKKKKISHHKEIEEVNDISKSILLGNGPKQVAPSEFGSPENWEWSKNDKDDEIIFCGEDQMEIVFHPNQSLGTSGIRGSTILDSRTHYWEVHLSQSVFGTSIMFGVATKSARLHSDSFINLLGEDSQGWGLSHKGQLWHNGRWASYTRPFFQNKETTIGLLYDGVAGTLTYYKDGINLGVAFRNLHRQISPLYPFVSSTTAKTKMTLGARRRGFSSLQERCRHVVANQMKAYNKCQLLRIPQSIVHYVQQAMPQEKLQFFPASMNTILEM